VKKITVISVSLVILLGVSHFSVVAEERKTPEREPDSAYVEKSDAPRKSGGLFDFLPFTRRKSTKIEPENLEPSPLPQESKPVLQQKELDQLRTVAEQWVLGTEYAEPTVREDKEGRYYRDYIVFADEYEAKVLRGQSEERPFIGHVYIRGDYFLTRAHDKPEDAAADFKFDFQTREFRIIFDRIKKWEYAADLGAEPFTFVERWVFRGLQSRPVVSLPEDLSQPKPPQKEEAQPPAPQPQEGEFE
jgi:hypothetical protein